MKNLLMMILAMSISIDASAEYETGNSLLSKMQDNGLFLQGVSYGYVVGAHDAAMNVICKPDGVTVQQLVDISKNYLLSHPESRQLSADSLVVRALMEKYPCRKSK